MHALTIVLSIKPQYINQIISGEKTVELRRRFPSSMGPTRLLLYSSSPVQAIVGYAVLDDILSLSLQTLWRRFSRAAAVTREEFDRYFHGTKAGYALKLVQVKQLADPIPRAVLARRFQFHVPQSYCYWHKPLPALSIHGQL